MYFKAPDGNIYDDGTGDSRRPFELDAQGRALPLPPAEAQALVRAWYADHPPAAIGGLSSAEVAQSRSRFPIGDVIARLTKSVGIKPCAPCRQRQAALNQAGDRLAGFFGARQP